MSLEEDAERLRTGAALGVFADLADSREDLLLGKTIGDYRTLELIAAGGASLNHPNITQLFDARLTGDGLPYIVMELVDGVSIDVHCNEASIQPRQIVELLLQIVDAIAYAHARLIVHRDIKPSNVLVDAGSRPKLLDFGIAKLLGDGDGALTKAAPLTPRYASPEQLLGATITTASDIYQFGLLAYELLAGRPLIPEADPVCRHPAGRQSAATRHRPVCPRSNP